MAKQRMLTRAPIVEALVDFRVVADPQLDLPTLYSAVTENRIGYYLKNPISEGTFGFTLGPDGKDATTSSSVQTGYRLHSRDEKYVAQFTLSGFTFSRLEPYQSWNELIREAARVWSEYIRCVRPKAITRLATRFINNLRLQMSDRQPFQDYLVKFADVPDGVPQSLSSFIQRFELYDEATQSTVMLTAALQASQIESLFPIILDIEAFKNVNVDVTNPGIWGTLEQLRDLKNRCFFNSITEKAAELFE